MRTTRLEDTSRLTRPQIEANNRLLDTITALDTIRILYHELMTEQKNSIIRSSWDGRKYQAAVTVCEIVEAVLQRENTSPQPVI